MAVGRERQTTCAGVGSAPPPCSLSDALLLLGLSPTSVASSLQILLLWLLPQGLSSVTSRPENAEVPHQTLL